MKLFRREKVPPREASLEELSGLWLKYNREFTLQEATGQVQSLPGSTPELLPPASGVVPAASSDGSPLYKEFIEPYRQLFESQGALKGAVQLIELLESHGNCPSVILEEEQAVSEVEDMTSLLEILARVSLKDHSCRVARLFSSLIRDTYRDCQVLLPKAAFTALGHDIGKIPSLREGKPYSTACHPVTGAAKISDLFPKPAPVWLNSVLEAIKSHHSLTRDPWTLLLKKADGRARQMEASEAGVGVAIKDWDEWFDAAEFAGLLRPLINATQTTNRWDAFYKDGTVYCRPGFLLETARTMARRKKVIDISLLRKIEEEYALMRIVNSLRKAGLVSGGLGEGNCGRMYEVAAEKVKRTLFLIPLKIEAFGLPPEIEEAKEGCPARIKSVKPTGR